jgi:MerR family transcriptional regulator, light-induced transcriptional regulator
VDDDQTPTLTIGTVAERTGVGVPVLRAWESRYGFPRPQRTAAGQRRYHDRDVDHILRVIDARSAGLSLEAAIDRAKRSDEAPDTSLFAGLRRLNPELAVHVLSVRAMLAISRAIEDECCARAERPVLLAAFQQVDAYRKAEPRWRELSRTASAAVVFADFPAPATPEGGPFEVPLHPDAPLRREWAVVCDSPGSAAVLSGWERIGPEPGRRFEAVWSADPTVVRRAARVGLALAAAGNPAAAGLADRLTHDPADPRAVIGRVSALTNRIVAYVDGL